MEISQYLEKLLSKYEGTFDIYKPYYMDGKEYPAYGYYFSDLKERKMEQSAGLWASHSYEHILFLTADKVMRTQVDNARIIISDYMEPVLVRKDGRVPEKKHMYSFLTVILISQYPPDKDAVKAVKRYSFEKEYRFRLRGFCTGRLVLVSMEDRKITCSLAAEKKRPLLQNIFEEERLALNK
nr:hypothetical protein [uncultured Eisenbergiella sp.]